MTADVGAEAHAWLAGAFALGAAAFGLGAVLSRSLFALVMYVAGAAAMCAAALLAQGRHEASLMLALFGVGLAPLLMLAVLALTTRTARAPRRRAPWSLIVTGLCVVGAAVYAVPDLGGADPAMGAAPGWLAAGLGAVMFVGAVGAVAVLAFGERGALGGAARAREEEPAP